ncbi:MAG: hypothetical protein IJI38_12245, partial [Clostridia bacterium]|nr:hypothetical protein [Clostridia bacterium]
TSGAHPLYRNDKECVWVTHETNGGAVYVGLFNLSSEEACIALPSDTIEKEFHTARELWSGITASSVSSILPPHGAALWRLD